MTLLMREIMVALTGKRFPLEDEKATQSAIWDVFRFQTVYGASREVRVAGGIIDFLIDDVGIEVKIKGQAASIMRQLRAYADEPAISGLILVTSKPVALGPTIGGKPVAVFDMARAWL
ncbi:conserved hypothetical protein [Hyphomicrobium denitrificans ATCC 51888]|uniref:DUF4143 domain-containing protein n=1 Tax=Hyphomicrobium denitrificans (strain ATCC 51888 / DSM 1869 / NCIMB 11706 / TK 0415) TaxID=582899 RepID=D8JVV4_HYPDA|nr:hypothetical protein [Hyphomicrobium denitrificans]ADJ22993.1 conserved hypothetical protein [Hyphomicrobium denitrificans ATCC 51888]